MDIEKGWKAISEMEGREERKTNLTQFGTPFPRESGKEGGGADSHFLHESVSKRRVFKGKP